MTVDTLIWQYDYKVSGFSYQQTVHIVTENAGKSLLLAYF